MLPLAFSGYAQEDELDDYEFKTSKKSTNKGPRPTAHKLCIGTGIANYYGDLNSNLGSLNPGLAYSIGMRFYVKKKITFQPQLSYFKLKGDDVTQGNAIRNLSFHSNNLECSFNLLYDFVEYEPRWDLRKRVRPYAIGNIGLLFFKPKANYEGVEFDLHQLQTEGIAYNTTTYTAAIGIGTHIALNERSNLNFEVRYTYSFSHYLDDVHGDYIDINDLNGIAEILADRTSEGGNIPSESFDGSHWKEGTKRGSSSLTDRYLLISIQYEVDIFKHSIVYPAF